jgi:hypothetical protein
MIGRRRLVKPTLGVLIETGCARSIPAGNVIEIPVAPPQGNRTVDVIWQGEQLMMFVNDLQDRSQAIDA